MILYIPFNSRRPPLLNICSCLSTRLSNFSMLLHTNLANFILLLVLNQRQRDIAIRSGCFQVLKARRIVSHHYIFLYKKVSYANRTVHNSYLIWDDYLYATIIERHQESVRIILNPNYKCVSPHYTSNLQIPALRPFPAHPTSSLVPLKSSAHHTNTSQPTHPLKK